MTYPIRQLGFGEIFDQSFRLTRDLFVPYGLIVMACLSAPTIIGQLIAAETAGTGFAWLQALASFGLYIFFDLVLTIVGTETYIGRPTTLGAAAAQAKTIFLPYLGTSIVMGFALLGLVLLLVVPAIYFFVAWSLLGPICALERVFGTDAMRRSRDLVRGRFWRAFGTYFVSLMAGTLVSVGVAALLAAIPGVADIAYSVLSSLVTVYTTIVTVVLYVDLRCRREDFDLEILAREVAGSARGPAPPNSGGPNAAAA